MKPDSFREALSMLLGAWPRVCSRVSSRVALGACLIACLSSCLSNGERFFLDDEVGQASVSDIDVVVLDQQAAVTQLTVSELRVWAQAPELEIRLTSRASDVRSFAVTISNALVDGELTILSDDVVVGGREDPRRRPTERRARFEIQPGQQITVSLAELRGESRFRFAVMGDIQTALDRVDDVFEVINESGELAFVLSTGDVVEKAKIEEYELFEDQLGALRIPFYSTIGNHEIKRDIGEWNRRFGRFNVHFRYRGVDFSFIDSANAGIEKDLNERLDHWLNEGRDRLHLVGTHYPPFDPVGGRAASFRSRKEGAALLAKLAEGNVDTTFYGHIHSYYAFSNAGIPAFISGGGGAYEERLDGIGRHFLVVEVDPQTQSVDVGLVRVD